MAIAAVDHVVCSCRLRTAVAVLAPAVATSSGGVSVAARRPVVLVVVVVIGGDSRRRVNCWRLAAAAAVFVVSRIVEIVVVVRGVMPMAGLLMRMLLMQIVSVGQRLERLKADAECAPAAERFGDLRYRAVVCEQRSQELLSNPNVASGVRTELFKGHDFNVFLIVEIKRAI